MRKRYSQEEKQNLIAEAKRKRSEGKSCATIISELGVCRATLKRWLNENTAFEPVFLPIVVKQQAASHQQQPEAMIISPAGYRVVGLNLSEIAALMRVLS
jgi:hypothetical protein